MEESAGSSLEPPPYASPQSDLQTVLQNASSFIANTTKPHHVFIETTNTANSRIYIHLDPTTGRYITHPHYVIEKDFRKAYEWRFQEPLQIAAIQNFTTMKDLIDQLYPCTVCPPNTSADMKLKSFVRVVEMEAVWRDAPVIEKTRIDGRGEEHARKVLGMMEQRGWKDFIRIKFMLTKT